MKDCWICGKMYATEEEATNHPCKPYLYELPKQFYPQRKQATKTISRRISQGVFEQIEVLI